MVEHLPSENPKSTCCKVHYVDTQRLSDFGDLGFQIFPAYEILVYEARNDLNLGTVSTTQKVHNVRTNKQLLAQRGL